MPHQPFPPMRKRRKCAFIPVFIRRCLIFTEMRIMVFTMKIFTPDEQKTESEQLHRENCDERARSYKSYLLCGYLKAEVLP